MLRQTIFLGGFVLLVACQADINSGDWVPMVEHEETLQAQKELASTVDSLQDLLAQYNDESVFEIPPPSKDSMLVQLQKQMDIEVKAPLLFTEAMVEPKLKKQFLELSKSTGGKLTLLAKSDEIQLVIEDLIKKHGQDELDLMIIMDNTGSMGNDIAQVRKGLEDILKRLQAYPNSRLAMATYGDKHTDPDTWYSFQEFGTNHAKMAQFIDKIKLTGGGDAPESVYDGVYQAMDEGFFRSKSKRMIILIGDAPSHEKKKTEYTVTDIIRKSRRDGIRMNFYPIIIHPGMRSLSGPVYGEESSGSSDLMRIGKSDQVPIIESIYPNPSPGISNLRFYAAMPLKISIYQQDGTLVREYDYDKKELRLDLEEFPDGVYLVRAVYAGRKFDQRKLIIKS